MIISNKVKKITVISLVAVATTYVGLYFAYTTMVRAHQPNSNLSYSLKNVDCSHEAKEARNKTPRGEYNSTAVSDACVITITVVNNEDELVAVDYLAIGGGPAGTLFNHPPVRIYSGNNFCYGLPTVSSFEPRSKTDVWVECLGSNDDGGRDQSADQKPTKIIIDGPRETILNIE